MLVWDGMYKYLFPENSVFAYPCKRASFFCLHRLLLSCSRLVFSFNTAILHLSVVPVMFYFKLQNRCAMDFFVRNRQNQIELCRFVNAMACAIMSGYQNDTPWPHDSIHPAAIRWTEMLPGSANQENAVFPDKMHRVFDIPRHVLPCSLRHLPVHNLRDRTGFPAGLWHIPSEYLTHRSIPPLLVS